MAYCTADDVARFLQTTPFGVATTPTLTQVDNIILRNEDKINQKLKHSWKPTTVTNLFLDLTFVELRNGIRFDLPNYSIKALSSANGDKLEVWNGNAYVDFLVSNVEGRLQDYWVDYTLGVLYLRRTAQISVAKPIRITYRYGELAPTGSINELCILLTSKTIVQMYQRNIRFSEDGSGSSTPSADSRINYFKDEIKDLYNSLSSIDTF